MGDVNVVGTLSLKVYYSVGKDKHGDVLIATRLTLEM
jgi:hypothetical protein